MKRIIITIAVIVFSFFSQSVKAQELSFGLNYVADFDNREFKPFSPEIPQTIFMNTLYPTLTASKNNHSIDLMLEISFEFGGKAEDLYMAPRICYKYHNEHNRFLVGTFNVSENIIGNYNSFWISDSTNYYDGDANGFLLQHKFNQGFVEFGCNWLGKIDTDVRERFDVFAAGEYALNNFNMGFTANMMHFANSLTTKGVVDFYTVNPYVSYDFNLTQNHKLSIQFEWIQTFQQDRRFVGHYVKPGGLQMVADWSHKSVGISNTLYLGDNLMPYFNSVGADGIMYGSDLYRGEQFYSTDCGHYDKLELYWKIFDSNCLYFCFATDFHFTNKYCGWQQKANLYVNIDKIKLAK